MKMTKRWVETQIRDYQFMLNTLGKTPGLEDCDKKLKVIWEAARNALEATLTVINLEMGA